MSNAMLLAKIRELCKVHNLTVNSLEKKAGLGTGTISRWNTASPSIDKVEGIARIFRITIDELVGYNVEEEKPINIDAKTTQIIEYLMELTLEIEEGESFWQDYKKNGAVNLPVSHLQSMKDEMGRLLYGCDEEGYYLLEVLYILNSQYDYDTQISLYLVPDEITLPVLECREKSILRSLYILAMKNLEIAETQRAAREKAEMQRERILKKYHERSTSKQENENNQNKSC